MTVEGDTLTRYVRRLTSLIDAARLNHFYPDPRRLRNVYEAMVPTSVRPAVKIDPRTGMPAEREVSRVFTDARLACEAVEPSPDSVSQSAAAQRVRARQVYHDFLRSHPPGEPTSLAVKLRRIEGGARKASFIVVFDRFDLAEAVFTRYTIQLAQVSDNWKRQQVELVGDDLSYTANFRNAISRFTSHEAEFAFLLLSDLPNVTVHEVVRGRVGPLFIRGAEMPPEFAELVAQDDAAILHLPLDRAGIEVTRDGCGDPLAILYRDFLRQTAGLENAEPVERRAKQLGYHVWKERKFCCTPGLAAPLSRVLDARGGRCVIRTLDEVTR